MTELTAKLLKQRQPRRIHGYGDTQRVTFRVKAEGHPPSVDTDLTCDKGMRRLDTGRKGRHSKV